jgi:ubiquinone/menaquinone biosynthesis C-methylase UbiE
MTRWNPTDYDAARLNLPTSLVKITRRLTGLPKADLVIDLGCGTGISTRAWAAEAKQTIGIDPSESMLNMAKNYNTPYVTYELGTSDKTGLPSHCADVVTCSSAIHWMEPKSTITEVCRLLKPNGLFAIFSYSWPPLSGFVELDQEFFTMVAKSQALIKEHVITCENTIHLKPAEFANYTLNARAFNYYREFFLSDSISLTGQQYVELGRSLGPVQLLIQHNIPPELYNFPQLVSMAEKLLKTQQHEMLVSWRTITFKCPVAQLD